jgi:predicted nucleotidyltransferase
MTSAVEIESIALFGSVSRGDSDQLSDKDVLLVGNSNNQTLQNRLSKTGYSVSSYNWQQMIDMSQEGSLFLQHLRQESQIIADSEGRLSDLLSKFRPLSDYSQRIYQNLELFEITSGTPKSPFLIGWAFDVLCVGFRNHAILELANAGRYIFSHSELVLEYSKKHNLSLKETDLLLQLRIRKREYRNRHLISESSFGDLQLTQAIIGRTTGASCLSTPASMEVFVAALIRAATDNTHWYFALRRLEGAYRAMGMAPEKASPMELNEIESIFAKPCPYWGENISSVEIV